MARLIFPVVAVALLWAAPAHASSIARWQPYVAEASLRFGIPEDWIMRVMHAESRGQTKRNGKPIRSRVGAMGLMQIMPKTWAAPPTYARCMIYSVTPDCSLPITQDRDDIHPIAQAVRVCRARRLPMSPASLATVHRPLLRLA
jgi:hypothetical protein